MRGIGSLIVKIALVVAVLLVVRLNYRPDRSQEAPRNLQLSQKWQLQPGDFVNSYQITGGLGDISIALRGDAVYAPFNGLIQPFQGDCVIFSSDEVPAYLFRFCGLKQPYLGKIRKGDAIGSGDYLQFATLRKLPSGTWSFVESSRSILEQTLKQP